MSLSDGLAFAGLALALAGVWRYRATLGRLPDDRVTLGHYARTRRALERATSDDDR